MPPLFYLDLDTTDAAWNLAAEQYVFESLPRDRSYFMLWQNRSAVIVGKHQDTLAEINRPYVEAHGIQVIRRPSGGGAVYHDLGNLNYTIITDSGSTDRLDLSLFCQPVLRILREMGVPAELTGRNDMTVDGKKFSGSAQYLRHGRIQHHGTLLFDSDLSVVQQALQVDPEKIRSKGLRSVRSRVTNLKPWLPTGVTLNQFRQSLLEELLRYAFTEADLAGIEALANSRYRSWEWNVGASPACSLVRRQRFEGCGTVEARMDVEHGRISALVFRGDFFSAREPEELVSLLIGLPPEPQPLREALAGADVSQFFSGLQFEQLIELLCE